MAFPLKNTTSSAGSSSLGLQGRLLEVAVVVGVDEETGLKQRMLEHTPVDHNDALFQMHFKVNLLDIVSGTQDTGGDVPDLRVHSGVMTSDPSEWRKSLRQVSDNSNPKPPTMKRNVQRTRSVRKLRKRANKEEDVPVSSDFLKNIPYLCLPDNSKVYECDQPAQTHFAVLTDMNGSRHYAAVLRVYQPFFAIKEYNKDNNESWRLRCVNSSTQELKNGSENRPIKCYAPLCICFVANLPYFDALKSSLSCLNKEWKHSNSYETFRKLLQKYVTNLSVVLCPPPSLLINFTFGGWPITLSSSDEPNQQSLVNDLDLTIPVKIFMTNLETLLQVLACIMLEQRIVFISENYSLITLVMEALLCYISPFSWPHQYVPLLFSEIIDFVACPGIFLMGCHSMHKEQIEQVENDQILVDLDTGNAYACASYEWNRPDGKSKITPLEEKIDCHFPPCMVERVMKRFSQLDFYNVNHLNSPNPVTLEDIQASRVEVKTANNKKIREIFMEMMVDLFSNTIYFLDHEINQFRTDEFMETVNSADLPFYLKVVKTYMFKKFMQDRLRRTPDTFSKVAEKRARRAGASKILPHRTFGKIRSVGDIIFPVPDHRIETRPKSAIIKRPSFKKKNVKPLLLSAPLPSVNSQESDTTDEQERACLTLQLPSFPVNGTHFNEGHFYKRCVELITGLLEKIPVSVKDNGLVADGASHHTCRAACLLARGLYLVASGSIIKGLDDLHKTSKEDFRLFPEKTIKTIIASLSQRELVLVKEQTYYKGDEFYEMVEGTSRNEPFYYSDDDLPFNPLNKNTMSMILEKSGVTSDCDIIDRLFEALRGATTAVDPETFAAFYHTWKHARHYCETALRSMLAVGNANVGLLQDSERILKVSSVVSSSRGSGRLILTSQKILFMTELYEECKLMVRLFQIDEIKLSKLKTFFRSIPALLFKQNGEFLFRIGLKSESELWMCLINEMKTGRTLSRDWKDHSLTVESAAQNVGVADALYQAVKDEEFMSMEAAVVWVKMLCNFTELHVSGQLQAIPQETDEMLVLKIDVSPKETKKSSVETVVFSSAAIDEIPRVWIALSSSKIRLIDTTRWTLDSRPIKDCSSKLLSMCVVNSGELWVGASDKSIYVIRCDSLKKSRVLHEHTAPVVAILNCGGEIVSASRNGEIIIWDKELKKAQSSFCISSHPCTLMSVHVIFDNAICCRTKSFLSICTLDGVNRQQLTLNEFFLSSMVESEITCCLCTDYDEIWAGDSHGSVFVWYRKSRGDVSPSSPLGGRHNRLVPRCTDLLYNVDNNISVTCLMMVSMPHGRKVWVGNSVGDITILNADTLCEERVLKAHDAAVTSLCQVENRYIISGSSSTDGKIAVWRTVANT